MPSVHLDDDDDDDDDGIELHDPYLWEKDLKKQDKNENINVQCLRFFNLKA